MALLTQNRELEKIDVWNFTLSAWVGRFLDVLGRGVVTSGRCDHLSLDPRMRFV